MSIQPPTLRLGKPSRHRRSTEMELAADRLWTLLEERHALLMECKTIPESLSRQIQEANQEYFNLCEYGFEGLQ